MIDLLLLIHVLINLTIDASVCAACVDLKLVLSKQLNIFQNQNDLGSD